MNGMTTEQILIDQILEDEFADQNEFKKKDEFFEFFSANLATKEFELTFDDIKDGIVGESLDGGIDGMFLFVNGELIKEDFFDFPRYKKEIKIELVIIQSKNVNGFGEDAIHKLRSVSLNLLRLDADFGSFRGKYNKKVISAFSKFVECYRALIARSPSLIFKYYYITKAESPHPNTTIEAKSLVSDLKQLHRTASVDFSFVGAEQLLELHRKRPRQDHKLRLAENPMSSTGKAFVGLVNIKDYYEFITDEKGGLIKSLFESNVRDYQGDTDVNSGISDSLKDEAAIDFWWLNNGVTILATDVNIASGKELVLINPEIVNGLQTSNEIYNFYTKDTNKAREEKRNVLVKIVVADVDAVRDNIIKAANSQNFIAKAVLRATDPIHRDIEEYLKRFGIYYDRRKNFYKNNGKKSSEIVSLPYVAQILMSTLLSRPDTARARPSTLLEDENEESYKQIFNSQYNIDVYKNAILLAKYVDEFLKSNSVSAPERNNIKFYVMQDFAIRSIKSRNITPEKFAKLNCSKFSDTEIKKSFAIVMERYKLLGGDDKVAKGKLLLESITEEQKNYFTSSEIDSLTD